ncbi:VOC family protein [Alicyclobacillus tolerans]|uniref:VOC family protein n=1 Tax=Alicyclobacillus tolerans TaxID=90970 RepID=UPI003B796277
MDGILGVDEVLFFVPDVQVAKRWYGELLGVEPYFDHEGYCAFRLANVTVGLHPSDEKNSSGVAGQVTYWRVSDILKTIAHFESHGCSKFRGPTFGVDQVWVCQVKDPFENVWGLVQRSERPE